jgi:hypothetical protein
MVFRCTYVHMPLPGVAASKLKGFHSFYGFEGLRGDYGPQKAVMALKKAIMALLQCVFVEWAAG